MADTDGRQMKRESKGVEQEACRADIGDGVICQLPRNHGGLHRARLPNGRVFEWG